MRERKLELQNAYAYAYACRIAYNSWRLVMVGV